MDVAAYLAESSAALEPLLEGALPPASEPPAALHAAMRHLLLPGGKRLRPALGLAACEAVGSPRERALPIALAVELLHGYSLIHDDLPCMDDDDERRGRPTVHVAFGEDVAVLAGDALQALAFEVLLGDGADALRAACAADLARVAGSRALVGGQADDLAFAGEADLARVESVHERKSAALIAAAVVGGARLGGATEAQLARLGRFAVEVGVAFQIADDLLDAGSDERCSVVRVLGVEGARARADERLARGLAELEGFGQPAETLRELGRFAVGRSR